MTINLKILLPNEIFLDRIVTKINAEADNGSFGILPNHIDFVTALVPGILAYEDRSGAESFIAVDEGILVKCDREVLISTGAAIGDRDLESLDRTVEEQFKRSDDREKQTRSALAKLQVGFVRGFVELTGGTGETPQ
jgi:F-type H+-transporting ATPase subunit epsilon